MSRIDEAIDVDVASDIAYDRWSRFESFPLFMQGVEHVELIGHQTYRWRAEIMGSEREWIAQVTQMIPGQRIAWTSLAGDLVHQGAVSFTPKGEDRCEVRVQMVVHPETFAETIGDTFGFISRRVQQDLEDFKRSVESGTLTGRR